MDGRKTGYGRKDHWVSGWIDGRMGGMDSKLISTWHVVFSFCSWYSFIHQPLLAFTRNLSDDHLPSDDSTYKLNPAYHAYITTYK